jgi:Fe-S oxidoreductase
LAHLTLSQYPRHSSATPAATVDSGATRLLSANIGCRLHLANGTAVPVQHPVDFLAAQLDTAP